MFFFGEDSVADNLSPYIDAAPKEEQKYFLATQQVDEARHAVFFHRFFKEVIGAGDDLASTLGFTESQLGWGYRNVFTRLDRMADELRRDRSLPKFAQAIALYHMVVEATLAQPGQHFIEDYFAKAGTMPGFSAGMENVSRDEQRHIGFGVKVLSELLAESDECKAAVRELLLEVMPYSLAVFVPPTGLNREYTRCYGFEMEDIFAFGMRSVKTKWRAIGYPMEEMPGVLPVDHSLARGDRAAPDQAARVARDGRAASPPRLLARGPAPLLRRDRELGRHHGGERHAVHDPVGLRRRRPVARGRRQRLDPGRARRGARRRHHLEGELGRLDRGLEGSARPAQRGAPPAPALPRLAAASCGPSRRSSRAGARSRWRS